MRTASGIPVPDIDGQESFDSIVRKLATYVRDAPFVTLRLKS